MASPQLVPSTTSTDSPPINSQAAPNTIPNQTTVYQKTKVTPHQSSINNTPALTPKAPPPISTKSLNKAQRMALPPEVTNLSQQAPQKTAVNSVVSMEDASKTSSNSAFEALGSGFMQNQQEIARRGKDNGVMQTSLSAVQAPSTEKGGEKATSSTGLGALPSIATAATAMQIDNDNSPDTSTASSGAISGGENGGTITTSPLTAGERSVLADTMEGGVLNTQISTHSMGEGLSAITPTTPGFSMSAVTPTTPFSPSLLTPITPGGGRGKHTCNHCSQTFTRHHNLKSHLLTHSHEKPYVCTSCQARFRRLHDLKRHTKLHTGERPHMCDKCGRRFARGDALARHARGEGGCAGRRSSIAGMNSEDPMMPDITGGDDDEDVNMLVADGDGDINMGDGNESPTSGSGELAGEATDINVASSGAAKRHASLPSIKTNMDSNHLHPFQQHVGHPPGHGLHPHSTYPPMTPARSASTAGPSPGGLFPPTPNHGNSMRSPSTATSSNNPNSALSAPGASPSVANTPHVVQQGNLTDSPRPISPGNQTGDANTKKTGHNYNRQQQSILPSPLTPQSANQAPLPNQPAKYPIQAQPGQQHIAPSSAAPSHPVPTQQASNSHKQTPPFPTQQQQLLHSQNKEVQGCANGATANPNMFENEVGLWDYVVKLERRVAEVEREMSHWKAMNQHQAQIQTAAAAVAKVNAVKQAQKQQQQITQREQQKQLQVLGLAQNKGGNPVSSGSSGAATVGSKSSNIGTAGGGEGKGS